MKNVDIIIMGSGPAGLQAAIHACRRCSVVVFGKLESSNLWNARIDNYLSVDYPISGQELLIKGKAKAEEAGVRFFEEDVIDIEVLQDGFRVKAELREVTAQALILAPGVRHEKLNIPGEKEFLGRGVSYCADCDCMFFKGKIVAVVGGGSAAVRAADMLMNFAKKVYLVYPQLMVSEPLLVDLKQRGVEIIIDKVEEIRGDEFVRSVRLAQKGELEVDGVFVELGSRGIYEISMQLGISLDPETMRFVQTDTSQQTNINGIFAAGDVTGWPFQLAKAVGQGCVAGLAAADFVRSRK